MTNPRDRISPWEWAAAAVAALMVAAVVITLVLKGHDERTPPRLAIAVEDIAAAGPDFLVRFALSNTGGSTAAQVVVQGELLTANSGPEISQVTFDYVPDGSTRRGGLLFRTDPRAGRLHLRPLGYREP